MSKALDYGSDSDTDTPYSDSAWSDDSDSSDEDDPHVAPTPAAPPAPQKQSPTMQRAMALLLKELQDWWMRSEHLMELMRDKQLPCESLQKMSDRIDTLMDTSLDHMVSNEKTSDPSVIPIHAIIKLTRSIKKYIFLKVGQVCCQKGNQDKCAKAANRALGSMKNFRTSAVGLYDAAIQDMLDELDKQDPNPVEDSDTDIETLFEDLTRNAKSKAIVPEAKRAKSPKPPSKKIPMKSPMKSPPKMKAAKGGA
jgi:hypothetical protein